MKLLSKYWINSLELLSESTFFAIAIKCLATTQGSHSQCGRGSFHWTWFSSQYPGRVDDDKSAIDSGPVIVVPSPPTSTCWRTTWPRNILRLVLTLRRVLWPIRSSSRACSNSLISGWKSFSSKFTMLTRNNLVDRGWGALRGKRSFQDFFSEKSKLPHMAWSWHQDRIQRGKKQELRHLPWQMNLKSPMLRG